MPELKHGTVYLEQNIGPLPSQNVDTIYRVTIAIFM